MLSKKDKETSRTYVDYQDRGAATEVRRYSKIGHLLSQGGLVRRNGIEVGVDGSPVILGAEGLVSFLDYMATLTPWSEEKELYQKRFLIK